MWHSQAGHSKPQQRVAGTDWLGRVEPDRARYGKVWQAGLGAVMISEDGQGFA